MKIFESIKEKKNLKKKCIAVLIDPDKKNKKELINTIKIANKAKIDLFLIGGSILKENLLEEYVTLIKEMSEIPVLIFPGNSMQITKQADGILFLSLLSGRNPDFLIGQQVISAPILKKSKLEIISTAYILIDGGEASSVSYISNTTPIPKKKKDIVLATALAAEMLGFKLIYLEAGSGAKHSISKEIISLISKNINLPIIVGGGINSEPKAIQKCQAGADIIVIGNAIEKNDALITKLAKVIHSQ